MARPPAFRAVAIDLVPIGAIPAESLAGLAARLSRGIALACHVAGPLTSATPRIPRRDQLDAGALVAALEPRAESGRLVVGVAADDIAVPVFSFVFGLARQGGAACVVSLKRADPAYYGLPADAPRRDARVVAEIRHELAHLAGLAHCPDHGCLMSFAGQIDRADARGTRFCEACRNELPGWLR